MERKSRICDEISVTATVLRFFAKFELNFYSGRVIGPAPARSFRFKSFSLPLADRGMALRHGPTAAWSCGMGATLRSLETVRDVGRDCCSKGPCCNAH